MYFLPITFLVFTSGPQTALFLLLLLLLLLPKVKHWENYILTENISRKT